VVYLDLFLVVINSWKPCPLIKCHCPLEKRVTVVVAAVIVSKIHLSVLLSVKDVGVGVKSIVHVYQR
jgi:hypothetical protein